MHYIESGMRMRTTTNSTVHKITKNAIHFGGLLSRGLRLHDVALSEQRTRLLHKQRELASLKNLQNYVAMTVCHFIRKLKNTSGHGNLQ